MIITHKIAWDKCLSHQIWPAIEKGWKDEDKNIHFFWGLAGHNIPEIKKCMDSGEEWWFVDTGYISKPITRYPVPEIVDKKRTFFRICKGSIHTTKGKVGSGVRLKRLQDLGLDVKFKGWYTAGTKHILLAPSSPTVTFNINGISQEQWVEQATAEIRKYTDREIVFRNKPRPHNKWWGTDIKDDLKNCHALVTNMSLSAIEALLNRVPVFAHGNSVMAPVSSRDLKFIEKPMKPGHKTMDGWLKFIAENQFTLNEIENGTAYNILKDQNED